jgi:hypothetical protein
VVFPTEQHQVVKIGWSAVQPVTNVVQCR